MDLLFGKVLYTLRQNTRLRKCVFQCRAKPFRLNYNYLTNKINVILTSIASSRNNYWHNLYSIMSKIPFPKFQNYLHNFPNPSCRRPYKRLIKNSLCVSNSNFQISFEYCVIIFPELLIVAEHCL